jgi:DNA-binding PadR family transcriptional regulator
MTDKSRPLSNPLALAVLVLLYERPMHPYEMASTLRERRKESSIKLNYGSLYTVIEQLLRERFIAVREVTKEGRRPEKTVYELTSAGEAELVDWMRELVSSPVKEYPAFEAALSLLPVLPPEEVIALLEIRTGLLKKRIEEFAQEERLCREMNLPRLFSLESEYAEALTLAEQKFSAELLSDIRRDKDRLRSGWTDLRRQLLAAKAGLEKQEVPKGSSGDKRKGGSKESHERKNR